MLTHEPKRHSNHDAIDDDDDDDEITDLQLQYNACIHHPIEMQIFSGKTKMNKTRACHFWKPPITTVLLYYPSHRPDLSQEMFFIQEINISDAF